jgi:hypothetical protein
VSDRSDSPEDPWAWLNTDSGDARPTEAPGVGVVVITPPSVLPVDGVDAVEAALAASSIRPRETVDAEGESFVEAVAHAVAALAPDVEWIWLLHSDAEPAPRALEFLLAAGADVVGALLIQPQRRATGTLVEEWIPTLSRGGRLRHLAEPGETYQGHFEPQDVLGVSTVGMLIRRDVFTALGGFVPGTPEAQAGLEFGWRARLAGFTVRAEPKALVRHRTEPQPLEQSRSAGLTLASAHTRPGRAVWQGARFALGSLLAALLLILAKDPARARAELIGFAAWFSDRAGRARHRAAVAALNPAPAAVRAAEDLRPGWREGLRRGADAAAGRLADWLGTFTERSDTSGLDDLTGDDFAGRDRGRGPSPLLLGGLAVLILAAVSARTLVGPGSLSAVQLLPAQPTWAELIGDYLSPVAGLPGLAGPAWLGLLGAGAALTFGQVEWLVGLLLLGCVPLTWLASYRFLRQLLDDSRLALVGGLLYALTPALTGALNRGLLGTAILALLVPLLGYTVLLWSRAAGPSWREAGAAGLLLLLTTTVLPLLWPVAAVIAVIVGLREGRVRLWAELGAALAAPGLILLGPGWSALLAFPGRLLTGPEPALAPAEAPRAWELMLGQGPGAGYPPLWLAAVVFGAAWIAAVAGVLRRGGTASWALGGAVAALTVAVALTHLVVRVAPGVEVRPQAHGWLVLMVAGLSLAAVVGLDGLGGQLRRSSLGALHALSLGLVAVVSAACVLALGWWAWSGQQGLSRTPVGEVPAFVRNAQVSPAPSRTLAVRVVDGTARWAVVQDDFPRLGESERGLLGGADSAPSLLARSVADRLLAGSADIELVPDLQRLGIGHIWLRGSGQELRTVISNVPGLGTGTGDDLGAVWPVPASGRSVVLEGERRIVVGDGVDLPSGGTGRRLVLAEPADPRWTATLGDVPLVGFTMEDGRQAFGLPSIGGRLRIGLRPETPWWAWVQLSGLGLLVLLALPGVRAPAGRSAAPPRRSAAEGARP